MTDPQRRVVPNLHITPPAGGAFLVLASGGIDSSTLLWLSASQGLEPRALFVDYGQAAADAEKIAVTNLCDLIGAPLRCVRHSGMPFGAGEIRGRNAYLLHTALLEFPAASGVVAIGIHSGTGYRDCSPHFLDVMCRSYDFHTQGRIAVAAPFLHWEKHEVYAVAADLELPFAQTYSCEAASTACGRCRSCCDRRHFPEGALTC